ncbi:MAG TPA: type II secretion system F family protein, partial [Candidatus Thermoplasmatota archaeon]|nr:type II secretion system F family protein [Candidatus Thermoplasmatota archaeon]
SLRTPAPRKPSAATHALHVAGVIASAALAITAIAVGRAPVRILDYTTLTPEHAPILLLGGAFLLGLSLFVGRNLPGFYEQLTERRDFYTGRSVLAQPKTFFVPAVGAFTLLFLVILVLLLLGVGAQGFRQPLQVGVVAFILAALAGSIWVSLRLARSEDQVQYRGIAAEERRGGKIVLFGSAAAASILLGLALVLYLGKNVGGLGSGAWIDVFALGLLLGLGPYGFYVHRRGKRIRNLEARFPEFLRDLAASHKSGLTLNASVAISARGEYGELTPEIRKMADQLSWNLSFEEALRLMAERVQTPLVQRTASLIIQAGKSGGNTTDVLLAAARDAREIKTLENERRTNMTLYTIIIYLTFIIFLVIVAVLYKSFVPEILRAGALARQAGPVGGGGIVEVLDLEEYRGFYFLAALVQGLGNGLLAGLMQTGRAIQGLRHSFLFVLAAYITFGWLL